MSNRRSTSTQALTATAALLLGSLATVATVALSSSAGAAVATPPAGSTLVVTGLGNAAPGEAQTGTVTLQDASKKPLAMQDVTLTVDHGFLTDGKEKLPATVGAPAGNLTELGGTKTYTTDANGQVTFRVGIERDGGFDDDGLVAALVTATAGGTTGQKTAGWSSADPLNGGRVDVALSPRQENPVAPAVTGDRTYFDVVARDQFGNPVVGAPMELFPTPTADYDYSDDFASDLASFGDFWVVNYVPGDIVTSVVWADAPTYTYASTTGTTTTGTKDVTGSGSASFYDVDFAASSYAIASSVDGNVPVGTTITKTVSVLDQRGRPVRGFDVRFFRFGPESGNGDEKATRETNALGQASFSFVGAAAGGAKITAVVSDGLSRRTLTSENGFRYNVGVKLAKSKSKTKVKVTGKKGKTDKAADETDVLTVSVDKLAAGASVAAYRVTGGGTLKPVRAKGGELDDAGRATLKIKDKNGTKATKYVVVVAQTAITFAATSAQAKVR